MNSELVLLLLSFESQYFSLSLVLTHMSPVNSLDFVVVFLCGERVTHCRNLLSLKILFLESKVVKKDTDIENRSLGFNLVTLGKSSFFICKVGIIHVLENCNTHLIQ